MKFIKILNQGYNMDMLYVLENTEKIIEFKGEPKIKVLLKTMVSKGLITEDLKLTKIGEDLLNYWKTAKENENFRKELVKDNSFEEWWKAYPPTDTFEYNGKTFKGTRSLRVKKDECKVKFLRIINSKEFTKEELIEALKVEVEQKMEASYKTGQNKLSYMQNSYTYLNQKTFEGYVELLRKNYKFKKKTYENEVEI